MRVREMITTLIESDVSADIVVSIGDVDFDIENVEDCDAIVRIYLKDSNKKEEEKTREVAGKKYIPVCPRGYDDCVWDPAYIQCFYPDWYKELYGDKTPTEAIATENDCLDKVKEDPDEEFYCYDDEDKQKEGIKK